MLVEVYDIPEERMFGVPDERPLPYESFGARAPFASADKAPLAFTVSYEHHRVEYRNFEEGLRVLGKSDVAESEGLPLQLGDAKLIRNFGKVPDDLSAL